MTSACVNAALSADTLATTWRMSETLHNVLYVKTVIFNAELIGNADPSSHPAGLHSTPIPKVRARS